MTDQLIHVNGADLYCHVSGAGRPLFLIPPAGGDGNLFAALISELSAEYMLITYDRRGNSRSPKPGGWTTTSVSEQAEDGAALLRALNLRQVAAFGSSGGGPIVLELALRHPELVGGLFIHEPAFVELMDRAARRALPHSAPIAEAMSLLGPTAAMESRLKAVVGADVWNQLDIALRGRLVGNADTLFNIELPAFATYRINEAALGRMQMPVCILLSPTGPEVFAHICRWLVDRVPAAEVEHLPGGHVPYLELPGETAQVMRRLLRRLYGEQSPHSGSRAEGIL